VCRYVTAHHAATFAAADGASAAAGAVRHTGPMPVPSRALKEEVDDTVDHHAAQGAALAGPSPKSRFRWRGSFGYLTALIEQDGPDERVPLCRIEYLGDDEDWGFAILLPGHRHVHRRPPVHRNPPATPPTPSTRAPSSTSPTTPSNQDRVTPTGKGPATRCTSVLRRK